MSAQGKFWVFTLNNPTETITFPDTVEYAVYQLEQGENGTRHYQGYVEFKKNIRLAGLKKFLKTAHWEKRRGTQAEARDYCMKEDTRLEGPFEHGTFVVNAQGNRTDLEEASELVKLHGAKRVAREMPAVYAKFHRGLHALEAALEDPMPDPDFVPRDWQVKVLDLIKEAADDRHIIWVKDNVGNTGKSRLAVHLQKEHGACQLSGRMADMAYMYDKEPVVCIDVPRTQAENMDHLYAFAESLKNGVICSTKYESRRKMFKPPHVIFFANVLPEAGKWSADRLILIDLDNQEPNVVLDVEGQAVALLFM